MIDKIKKIKNVFISNIENNKISKEIIKQNLGYQILQPLMIGHPYLPYNGGAIRPFNISLIINDIIINERKTIVEFGGGISTILISRLIKKNNLDCELITVEHNLGWQIKLKSILEDENISHKTKIIHAPFKEVETPFGRGAWYDFEDNIFNEKAIDLIIIDGPPAYTEELKHSRYPAMAKVYKYLSQNHMIYLDDSNRSGERDVIRQWEKDYKIKFTIEDSNYATYISHDSFGVIPFQLE